MKVYLDYNSTVPLTSEHLKEVVGILEEKDGNPSNTHFVGRRAKVELEKSRKALAKLVGAKSNEIIFNSGATEGNNHVLVGFASNSDQKPTYIISQGEHSSVYETCKELEKKNQIDLVVVPLLENGTVDQNILFEEVEKATANKRSVLVSVIYVNNETGIINSVHSIASKLKEINSELYFHVDSVQALGKLNLENLANSEIDSAVFSAHKIGGFKGVGAIYKKKSFSIAPVITGGGQERSQRSGTENLPGIVSFGLRCEALANKDNNLFTSNELFEKLISGLKSIDNVIIHGDLLYSNKAAINFHLKGCSFDKVNLLLEMAGIAVSNGSACSSGVAKPSRVLLAMGYDENIASNSLRVSLGEQTTEEEVEYFVNQISNIVKK